MMNSKAKRKAYFIVLKDQIELSFPLTEISYFLTDFPSLTPTLPAKLPFLIRNSYTWSRISIQHPFEI